MNYLYSKSFDNSTILGIMNVEVLTPDQKVFEGQATGVQMPGIDGSFEVLENHAPLISALGKGQMRIATTEGAQVYNINGGFVEVLNNRIVVLVEGATKLSASN